MSWRWLWLFAAAAWIALLSVAVGPLPPLGPLFDVHSGVWNHQDFAWVDRGIPGLKAPVKIAIDSNSVPHFFAENEEDLYLAQGYVMAAQRLFQMDLSSRSTSGHLAELVGEKGLEMDRFFVRFGMRQSILKTVNEYMAVPQTANMINAFVAGVNAYIQGLSDIPVEYKLLRKRPEFFDASRVISMARALTYNLSGYSDELALTHIRQQIGVEKVLDLFPEFYPSHYADYVLPGSWGKERTPEKVSDFIFETAIRDFPAIPRPSRGNGSNNWVVGPKKSVTGHSILANDTHLGYSLPNIWFENQLTCPEFNVYGVSLVDVPGIINGFTAQTAWGPTNGTTDALDYYQVTFADDSSLKYKDGEQELEAQVFNETIIDNHGGEEILPVTWTKWGPLLHREGKNGLVANWTGYQTANELLALRQLYDSKSVTECLAAFRLWNVPIQNFVCADQDHIGILHAGLVPKRAVGEGRFIQAAGSSRWSLTKGVDKPLTRVDPDAGYLLSANQRIVNSTYDNYMGEHYEEYFRGMRIREFLEGKAKLSSEDLMALQNDDLDQQGRMALPKMLKAVSQEQLSPEQKLWLSRLSHWDYRNQARSVEPSLFRAWFKQLKREVFADEYALAERPNFLPDDMRMIWALDRVTANAEDSDAQWIDDKQTPTKEDLSQIVTRAFIAAWKTLEHDFGAKPAEWTWMRFNKAQIPHIARLPGFGSEILEMNGAGENVRGNKGWHGPVYKFVIELGPEPRGWMQVPGGNEGDPFNPGYGKNVNEWARGDMRQVQFYKNWDDAVKRSVKQIRFTPRTG